MKLYFISALCKSRELFGLLPLLLAAIRLGKYLHVMAFEGIYVAPMRPAWLVDDDTSTPDFPPWKMTKANRGNQNRKYLRIVLAIGGLKVGGGESPIQKNKYLFAQILFCFPPNLFGLAKRSKLYRQTFYGTNFTVYPYLWLNINTRKLFISLHVTSISCSLLLNNKRKCFQLIICRRQVHENLKVSRKIQLWRRYHLNKSKRTPKNVGERSKQGLSICRCSIDIWSKYRLAISCSSWRGKEL